MARADSHEPFAHIAAGRDAHAQPVARILVDEGPVGARKHTAFGFGHEERVARALGAGIEDHLARIGGQLARHAVEQRRLARAAFADDAHDLARPEVEADVETAGPGAIAAREVSDGEERGHAALSLRVVQ